VAVSSTQSSSASVASGLDVTAIVSGLMSVERQPVDKIDAKIADITTVISSLGTLKSKVAGLQAAAEAIENSAFFGSKTASTTNSAVVTASASVGASIGNHEVKVAQTAQAARVTVSGFASADEAMDLSSFSLQVTSSGTTYAAADALLDPAAASFAVGDVIEIKLNGGDTQTFTITDATLSQIASMINDAVDSGDLTGIEASVPTSGDGSGMLLISSTNPAMGVATLRVVNTDTPPKDVSGTTTTEYLPTDVTLTELKTFINDLGAGASARVLEKGSDNFALILETQSTGESQTIALSTLVSSGNTLSQSDQLGRDAYISVDGAVVQRDTNTIDDVLYGVVLTLSGAVDGGLSGAVTGSDSAGSIGSTLISSAFSGVAAATVGVTRDGSTNPETVVRDFVTAYNDLVAFYKSETASNVDPAKRGTLSMDSSVRDLMTRIRSLYDRGIYLADGSTLPFSQFGVELQRTGELQINELTLSEAVADGLGAKLAEGVRLGRESATVTLTSYLRTSIRSTGFLTTHTNEVQARQTRLEDKRARLESRLSYVETRLYRQYAALDALLMRMQITSNALTSAIDSLTASQANN
jgi:flagellar hook-associated protein 2